MIKPYGLRRNLIENAVPNQNLPQLDKNNENSEIENNVEFENNDNNNDKNNELQSDVNFKNNLEFQKNVNINLINIVDNNLGNLNKHNQNFHKNKNISSKNVQDKFIVASTSRGRILDDTKLLQQMKRKYKKKLHKKKAEVKKYKRIVKLQRKNQWETVTADVNSMQRTFLEMIQRNRKYKSQVCF